MVLAKEGAPHAIKVDNSKLQEAKTNVELAKLHEAITNVQHSKLPEAITTAEHYFYMKV